MYSLTIVMCLFFPIFHSPIVFLAFMKRVLVSFVDVLSGYIKCLDYCFMICHIMFAACFRGLVKLGAHSLYSIVSCHPLDLISRDPDDSQIYEEVLTVVYAKQIISCDEWVTLVMKLHQP